MGCSLTFFLYNNGKASEVAGVVAIFFIILFFMLHSGRVVINKRITIHKVSQTDHGLRYFFSKMCSSIAAVGKFDLPS